MGMDIFGIEPENEKGEYFRNTVWYWHPLWNYLWNELDVLTPEEHREGHFNEGLIIIKEKSKAIAKKLNRLIATGETENYIEKRREWINGLPDRFCYFCQGTGKIDPNPPSGKVPCHVCNGTGIARSPKAYCSMNIENMKGFAEFCEYSGGFEIW